MFNKPSDCISGLTMIKANLFKQICHIAESTRLSLPGRDGTCKAISYRLKRETRVAEVTDLKSYMELLKKYSFHVVESVTKVFSVNSQTESEDVVYDRIYGFVAVGIDFERLAKDYDAFHLSEEAYRKLVDLEFRDFGSSIIGNDMEDIKIPKSLEGIVSISTDEVAEKVICERKTKSVEISYRVLGFRWYDGDTWIILNKDCIDDRSVNLYNINRNNL